MRVPSKAFIARIVSGGQTGADRAALDFARSHGIPHGGWCPQGRLAEDGPIAEAYSLRETPTPYYTERTQWNVRDSDVTVIITIAAELSGGSKATADHAKKLGKPCLHLSRERDGAQAISVLVSFLRRHGVRVLNLAGPRASSEPGITAFVTDVLNGAVMPVQSESGSGREDSRVGP